VARLTQKKKGEKKMAFVSQRIRDRERNVALLKGKKWEKGDAKENEAGDSVLYRDGGKNQGKAKTSRNVTFRGSAGRVGATAAGNKMKNWENSPGEVPREEVPN